MVGIRFELGDSYFIGVHCFYNDVGQCFQYSTINQVWGASIFDNQSGVWGNNIHHIKQSKGLITQQ